MTKVWVGWYDYEHLLGIFSTPEKLKAAFAWCTEKWDIQPYWDAETQIKWHETEMDVLTHPWHTDVHPV